MQRGDFDVTLRIPDSLVKNLSSTYSVKPSSTSNVLVSWKPKMSQQQTNTVAKSVDQGRWKGSLRGSILNTCLPVLDQPQLVEIKSNIDEFVQQTCDLITVIQHCHSIIFVNIVFKYSYRGSGRLFFPR